MKNLINEIIKKELNKIYLIKEQVENSSFLKNFKEILDGNKTYKETNQRPMPYDEDVEDIQIALQFLKYSLPEYGVDGLYGPETENAVKEFQKDNDLSASGIVDKETLQKIYDSLVENKFSDSDLSSIEKTYGFDTSNKGEIGNAKDVIDFFTNKGLTKEQSAGIAANIERESSYNPNAVGDSKTSFGIAQWHKERGQNMIEWTKSNGFEPNSMEGQLEYMWHELTGDYKNVLNQLKNTSTAQEAAEVFVRKYEIPSNIEQEVAIRSQKASKIMDMA